jgi:hypothetical protein
MAFFKSLIKEHGKQYFEPIGKALAAKKIDPKRFNPLWPGHALALRNELWAYAQWKIGQAFTARDRQSVPGMDARLQSHVDFALSAVCQTLRGNLGDDGQASTQTSRPSMPHG